MTFSIKLLDEVRATFAARNQPASDYAVANALGVTRATMSRIRVGKGQFDDDIAVKLAEMAGRDPAEVLISIYAERTHSESARHAFERVRDALRKSAATATSIGLAALACMSGTPREAEATPVYINDRAASLMSPAAVVNSTFYTSCVNALRRFVRSITPPLCRPVAA